VVSNNLPEATIVFDHFHLIKTYNDKLSTLRRNLHNQAAKGGKRVLIGTRWLFRKNRENLNDSRNEKQRLDEASLLNRSLATAYYLKEDLRQLWPQSSKQEASAFLDDLIELTKSSGIHMLTAFSVTFEENRDGILAYYDFSIFTGSFEGTNNKIKTLQKQAYGFRDLDFLEMKIYDLYEIN